jgi:hypothetical protein
MTASDPSATCAGGHHLSPNMKGGNDSCNGHPPPNTRGAGWTAG